MVGWSVICWIWVSVSRNVLALSWPWGLGFSRPRVIPILQDVGGECKWVVQSYQTVTYPATPSHIKEAGLGYGRLQ